MSNRNNGCRGCGGRGRCTNNIQCGNGNGVNPCIPRPIVAVDANCTPPTANGTGSIVPFSSGTIPAVLVTTALGLIATASAIGFGTSVPDIIIGPLDTIDLGILPSEAFSVPRAGNITAISASFIRLLMVFSATTSTAIAAAIVGNASAGITID